MPSLPSPIPIESEHSELSPSSSDKWMVCHAWRRLNVGIVEPPSSAAAEEGTQAHALLENILNYHHRDWVYSPKDPIMGGHIEGVMRWVRRQKGTIVSEGQIDFGSEFGYVGLFGTADVVIVSPNQLTVCDLKYGRGLVEVEDNSQLMIYLLGAIAKYGKRKKYRIVIMQPRADHFKGPIRQVVVPATKLNKFKVELQKAIAGNYANSPPTIGPHCRKFCKALAVCPGVRNHAMKLFKETAYE